MSKRAPTFELNADNWDTELEKEEIGEFKKADQSTIAKRKIIHARRSNASEVKQTGLFKSFTGFSKPNDNASSVPSFSFTSNNRFSSAATPKYPKEYIEKVADLNSSLLEWVKKNLEKDKSCIFTPVFEDYSKHLKTLNEKYKVTPGKDNEEKPAEANSFTQEANKSLFSMKPALNLDTNKTETKPSLFSFTPSTSNNQTNSDQAKPNTETNNGQEEDEDYVPPEPEKVELEEKGSVYTVKCKIYFKNGEAWKERGVGNLFIKPPEGCEEKSEKFQLLVRTDSNLGNILLNVNITSATPVTLMKNNVSIVTVPNPAIPEIKDDSKAVPMLLRVKTQDAAKELHEKFKQFTSK